jgi:hypothetical protein
MSQKRKNLKGGEIKMVGIESSQELAEDAQKVKVGKMSDAEKKRQNEFYAKLRARKADQPVGAQYE